LDQICCYLRRERYVAGGVWVDRFEFELIIVIDYHEDKGRNCLLRGTAVVATDVYFPAHEWGE
jgi:hypothetical protein